jgi:hypothetical protein
MTGEPVQPEHQFGHLIAHSRVKTVAANMFRTTNPAAPFSSGKI